MTDDPLAEFLAAEEQASREAAPVLAMIIGDGGSGKTYSSLLLARGLVGPDGVVGVIDIEGGRPRIYADDPDIGGFRRIPVRPPVSSERCRAAVRAAIEKGWNAIIIDGASNEWEGEGGVLEFAEAEERRLSGQRGASRSKWIKPKLAHSRFITTACSAPAHVIFCIHTKTIVDTDNGGKLVTEPVCDKRMNRKMDLVIELDSDHHAHFVKVPKPFLPHVREGERISVAHGHLLMAEAGKGNVEDPEVAKQRRALEELARDSGTDALATAWSAISRTKIAAVLKPELERLKQIAKETDEREMEAAQVQGEPAPHETLLFDGAEADDGPRPDKA